MPKFLSLLCLAIASACFESALADSSAPAPGATCDNSGAVRIAYRQVLEREPNNQELDRWTLLLLRGHKDAKDLVGDLATSDEHVQLLQGKATYEETAKSLLAHLLGKTETRYEGVSSSVRDKGIIPTIHAVLSSPEYLSRFGNSKIAGDPAIKVCTLVSGPMSFRRDDNFGDFRMVTEVTISRNGEVEAITETNNLVSLKGNCGTVAVWIYDDKKTILQRAGGQQYCLDGKFFGTAVRRDVWRFRIDPTALSRLDTISVLHERGSKNSLELLDSNLTKALSVMQKAPR